MYPSDCKIYKINEHILVVKHTIGLDRQAYCVTSVFYKNMLKYVKIFPTHILQIIWIHTCRPTYVFMTAQANNIHVHHHIL